jgi:hypothetical protein
MTDTERVRLTPSQGERVSVPPGGSMRTLSGHEGDGSRARRLARSRTRPDPSGTVAGQYGLEIHGRRVRKGDCYRTAAMHVLDADDGWWLVHGTWENPDGSIISHAWAVSPDGFTVFDGGGAGERIAPLYYRQVASVVGVFSKEDVSRFMLSTRVWKEWRRDDPETATCPVPPQLWSDAPWLTPELMARLRAVVPDPRG